MNAAPWGRQTFTNGAANTKNFNCGSMMRIRETPQVKVVIIAAPAVANRTVPIGGIGGIGGTGGTGGLSGIAASAASAAAAAVSSSWACRPLRRH